MAATPPLLPQSLPDDYKNNQQPTGATSPREKLQTAANKIQKFYRANLFKLRIPQLIERDYHHRILAYNLMEDIIDEYMEEMFMVDVICEVLSGEGEEYDQSEENRTSEWIYGKILDDTIIHSIRSAASLTIDALLGEYFEETFTDKNPLTVLIDKFCDEEVPYILKEIVRETIDDDVMEFLFNKQCQQILDTHVQQETLGVMISEVADEALYDESIDDIVGELMNDAVSANVEDIAYTTLPQIQALEKEKMFRFEMRRVEKVSLASERDCCSHP